MNKMRKILCIILTCLICSITPIVLAVDATQLQDKQKEVQEQINKTNNELSDLKMDITENLEQVQKLDEKIATAEAELAETTEKVEILQTTIKQLEEQQKTEQEKSAKFLCSEARFVERRFPNHPRCAEQADL